MTTSASAPRAGFPTADLKSGFLVFLIALPLCLGIALASGFPPVSGILTAVIGGMIVSFLGSARLTIKGPAAGLIVIVIGAVQELGEGDATLGYKRALAVGVVAAGVQLVFALLRAASMGIAMSPSVVHGMLAAIGVIIISKQSHTMMGVKPEAKEPLHLLAEIPHSLTKANPEIFVLALVSLAILFLMPLIKQRWAKVVPAPIVVLLVAVPAGLWFDLDHPHDFAFLAHNYHMGPEYLVRLPGSLVDAIAFPDFSQVFSPVSLKYVVMYAMVGTIESTLSALAVDSMDPTKEASNLNKDLFALSVGNLVSAFIGGMPMISEIVRSKANVDAGAKSPWSNFFHGTFLLAFVALAPGLLGEIPLAALAAMLVFTGTRLASPAEFKHVKHVGTDQFFLFFATMILTLATDLLIGVAAGFALEIVLHVVRGVPVSSMLRPKVNVRREGERMSLEIDGAATFATLLSVRRAFLQIGADIKEVVVDLSRAAFVDHTFLYRVDTMSQEWPNAKLSLVGLDGFDAQSDHPQATRRKKR